MSVFDIPPELGLSVFEFLDTKSLDRCSSVSRLWHKHADSDELWRLHCQYLWADKQNHSLIEPWVFPLWATRTSLETGSTFVLTAGPKDGAIHRNSQTAVSMLNERDPKPDNFYVGTLPIPFLLPESQSSSSSVGYEQGDPMTISNDDTADDMETVDTDGKRVPGLDNLSLYEYFTNRQSRQSSSEAGIGNENTKDSTGSDANDHNKNDHIEYDDDSGESGDDLEENSSTLFMNPFDFSLQYANDDHKRRQDILELAEPVECDRLQLIQTQSLSFKQSYFASLMDSKREYITDPELYDNHWVIKFRNQPQAMVCVFTETGLFYDPHSPDGGQSDGDPSGWSINADETVWVNSDQYDHSVARGTSVNNTWGWRLQLFAPVKIDITSVDYSPEITTEERVAMLQLQAQDAGPLRR